MVSCLNCGRTWSDDKRGRNSLSQHKSRHTTSSGTMSCISKQKRDEKRDEKKEATDIIKKIDPIVAVKAVEQQTNHDKLMNKMDKLLEEMTDIKQQNNELKDMVTEFARNPQLLILVDKLYPLSSLRELDLTTPAFQPVLEILDKELPEYPNLVNDETGKVHCKAVKKLNEIQPTVVKDDEKLFYKKGDVLTRGSGEEATKEFIDVIANSGYEYAQKASNDLKSRRESDKDFQRSILKSAACHASIQNVTDI